MKTPSPKCPRCNALYSVQFKEHGGRPGKHPMLLHCGHTFCEACLQKFPRIDQTIECPTCQVTTKLGGERELHKLLSHDLYTMGLIWTRRLDMELQSQKIMGVDGPKAKKKDKKVNEAKSGTPCSECHNTASCQCLRCDCVLCKPCFDKIHQMSKSLKKHIAVPITEISSGITDDRMMLHKKLRPRTCSTHEGCQIEYFCKDDNLAICSRCVIMGDHKGHNVYTMEDKNKECLSEMEPAILVAQETLWRLEKSEKLMAEAVPASQFDSKGVEGEIRLHFRELHSFLQAREEQLLDKVREVSQNASKPIDDLKHYLQTEKQSLENMLMEATHAMQVGVHRMVDLDQLLERLNKVKETACVVTRQDSIATPYRFSFDESFKETMMSYGDVSSANSNHMFTLNLPGPDAEKPPAEELRHFSVSDCDAFSTTDTDSIADSASVIVEEEKDGDSAEEIMSAEIINTEPAKDLPSKRLVVGHSERVQVTHIRTPAQFYVQLASRRADLNNMQRHINQHCRSSHGKKDVAECVDVGTMVLAQFSEDNMWYRARVTRVLEPDDQEEGVLSYQVFFIDYGNLETVNLRKMRKMKKKFQEQPAFCYECVLYDILPVDESEGWTMESVKTMLQMTSAGPMIMMVVNTIGGILHVDLSKPEGDVFSVDDRPVSVRDSLVFLEMAIFNTRSPHAPVATRMARDYITMSRAREGTICDVGINCVHSPSLFYAQIFSDRSHEHLHNLLVSMQEMYREETQHLYTIFCPKKDMICAAKYHKDSNWYRARVTGLPGHRKVEVQFVDYGNTEIVNHSDICKILDEYIKYPVQAMECSLADVTPLEHGQWSTEAKAWFTSLVQLQACQMRVTAESKKPNCLKGVLYAVDKNKLCCVNYELVRRGFAKATGQWSKEELYIGITLRPEHVASNTYTASSPLSTASGSYSSLSSSPSPIKSPSSHRKAARSPGNRHTPSPHKAPTPRKPKSKPSPNNKLKVQVTSLGRNVALENGTEGPVMERVGAASCQPEKGSVAVSVSGYQSPAHFYIQLEEKRDELSRLMVDLANYETVAPTDRVWKEGDFCVAKFSKDHRWYRAKLITQLEPGTFQVQLVDFGFEDKLAATSLRPLKKAHGSVECFAERCHLVGVMPAGSRDQTKWSHTATEFVPGHIKDKRLFVKLEGECLDNLGLPVDILIEEIIPETAFDPQSHIYVSLAKLLLDKGLALPMKRQNSNDSDSFLGAQPVTPTAFNTKLLTAYLDSSPIDDDDVGNDGVADVAKEEEEEEEEDDDEEPAIIIQPDYDIEPHPAPLSTRLSVLPVYVDYHGIIYAHDFDEEEKSTELAEELDEYVRKEAPAGMLQVKVCQVCLAYFDADNAWYRARVLEVDERSVKVKYLDFGNTGRVDRTQIRLITPELCSKPQVAYEFKLHNLKPDTKDETWPISFLEYMHAQIVNHKCTAEIKGSMTQHSLEVELVLPSGSNISDLLLEIGVVVRDNKMEEFFERSHDITNILKHSNPFFPLRPGGKGEIFHGLVTHIELPNLVYIQRCASSPDAPLPPDVLEFVQMMDDLNSLPPQTSSLEELPAAGEMCSACFSQDKRWYRALVAKAIPASKTVLIFYVDYGNSEIVPLDRLRVLPQRFQDTPAQALRAYLDLGLPEHAQQWTLEVYKAMAQAVFLRRHIIHIKHEDPLTVELFCEDVEESPPTTLSYQQLILEGLVRLPTERLMSAEVDEDSVIVESDLDEELASPVLDEGDEELASPVLDEGQ